MSPSSTPPQAPNRTWSALLADRYHCHLSPVLADWFDHGPWNCTGMGEYREPVAPELLLRPAPDEIWPGLMCCDLLPLIGNSAGDWLCARINHNDVMAEIVQWYHGGGDWIPWGNELSEAILFDAALGVMASTTRRHAVPAEDPRPLADSVGRKRDPIFQWALSHSPKEVVPLFNEDSSSDEIVETLLQAGVAEVALRCEQAVSLLTHWPRNVLSWLFRKEESLDRSLLAKWSFDVDLMPDEIREKLRDETGVFATQDWEAAAGQAASVCRKAPDQAWAWEIRGYQAERSGNLQAAIEWYHQAAQCTVFTDQSIRLDTHWLSSESAKFSVARIAHLCPEEMTRSAYYRILCLPDARQRRVQVTKYWTDRAGQHAEQGQPAEAHRCYMAAAWDLGAEPISSFTALIESIATSAEAAGQSGRAELAHTHRRCLRERYGV